MLQTRPTGGAPLAVVSPRPARAAAKRALLDALPPDDPLGLTLSTPARERLAETVLALEQANVCAAPAQQSLDGERPPAPRPTGSRRMPRRGDPSARRLRQAAGLCATRRR